MQDNFKDKAGIWDKGSNRVNGAKTIANAIRKRVPLNKTMKLIDFGVGTGLLGFEILPDVSSMTGIDTSKTMLEKLQEKNTSELYIKPLEQDIVQNPLNEIFNGVISSMTLHHVENIKLFFQTLYKNLSQDGFIAIADLETEDGSFHSSNEGVFHFGFNKKELCDTVASCGFKDINFETINTINKPQRDFKVFLLTAKK